MRRRSTCWVAAIITLTACSGGGRSSAPTTTTRATTTSAASTSTTIAANPVSTVAALITGDGLMADVEALAAHPRASDDERERTRAWLEQQLRASGYTVERWHRAEVNLSPVLPVNIVARRLGTTTPEQVLVVAAHYDSVVGVVGADDNASGVAAVLGVARAFARAEVELAFTVEFVFFDLEELGLLGSVDHVRGAFDGRRIMGVINLESVGYTCPADCQPLFADIEQCLDVTGDPPISAGVNTVIVADERARPWAEAFLVSAHEVAPHRLVGIGIVQGAGTCLGVTRRSDHAPFWDAGFPGLMVTDMAELRNVNYHRASDVPATLDPVYLADVARSVAATVMRLTG